MNQADKIDMRKACGIASTFRCIGDFNDNEFERSFLDIYSFKPQGSKIKLVNDHDQIFLKQ